MGKPQNISTQIDSDIKRALDQYCKSTGQKISYVIEQGIIEQIEDRIDLLSYNKRKDEETVSLEELLK